MSVVVWLACDRLGNPVVLVPMAGNLWQVRDTKNLMRMRNMAQLFANDGGGFPTDAGVHLIENQRRYLVRTRQNAFHGEHDTGEFTTGSNAGYGSWRLAGIGGEEILDLVNAVSGQGHTLRAHEQLALRMIAQGVGYLEHRVGHIAVLAAPVAPPAVSVPPPDDACLRG